tara:strand:- start:4475 stop:5683 length:1209 start_codon:yes stop_codon:yes gene_type:complete
MSKEKYNIVIIGAGLTGLAFCNLLKKSDIKIKLIDNNPESFYKNIMTDRYIVLSNTSRLILESIDLWEQVSKYCTKIKNIHISKKNIFGSTLVKSRDENLGSLGYQIPIQELIRIFYENIKGENNIEISHESDVTAIESGDNVKISFSHKSVMREITANSVIFSTGAADNLVDSIFTEKIQKDYQQNAFTCEIVSDKYNCETAFERFTNLGILGVIPRKEGNWTLIYSTNKEESEFIYNLDNKKVVNYFQKLLGEKCGKIREVNNINIYPLKMKYHKSFTKNNICLLGDAAHTLHPIAAQSFNLSLRDCAYLTTIIKEGIINNRKFSKIFEEYHFKRIKEVERLVKFTDTLASFIHGDSTFKNNIISLSFLIMDTNKKLRVNIIRYLLGINFSQSLISNLKE